MDLPSRLSLPIKRVWISGLKDFMRTCATYDSARKPKTPLKSHYLGASVGEGRLDNLQTTSDYQEVHFEPKKKRELCTKDNDEIVELSLQQTFSGYQSSEK